MVRLANLRSERAAKRRSIRSRTAPFEQRVVVPVVHRLALGVRDGLVRLERIVDDDDVGAVAGQHAADRGGEPPPSPRSLRVVGCLVGQACPEQPLVSAGFHDRAGVAGELGGQVLAAGDGDDLRFGVMAKPEGRQSDRRRQRLQRARRHADDEPGDAGCDLSVLIREDTLV